MQTMKLLLAEDDLVLSTTLSRSLHARGYDVFTCADGLEALAAARRMAFHAIVLDLGLPSLDGLELLARLRDSGHRTPVLVLTARAAVHERIAGLEQGADDYLTKPFDVDELHARLKVLMRRFGRDGQLRCGLLRFNTEEGIFLRGATPLDISQREGALLRHLMDRVDGVVSKADLVRSVYGEADAKSADAIEVLVHRLRKKLQGCAVEILTLRGVGYMLCDDATAPAPRAA